MKSNPALILLFLSLSSALLTSCQRAEEPAPKQSLAESGSADSVADPDREKLESVALAEETDAMAETLDVVSEADAQEWFERLKQRMVHKHAGGGIYEIPEGQAGYDQYQQAVRSARRLADQALRRFPSYNITTDGAGNVTGGISFKDKNFGHLMDDFYGLGLALSFYPEDATKGMAREFVKWLQWAQFTPEAMDHWYLSTLGRSFLLFHEVLDDADLEYMKAHLFGTVDSPGKGLINKIIEVTRNGPEGNTIGLRNADALRAHGEFILCGILLLPHSTEEELGYKQERWQGALESIREALLPSDGIRGFLKPDYTGSHHYYAYTSAYVPQAAASLAGMVHFLQGTPWQYDAEDIKWLQGYVKNLFFYAHYDHVPLGLSGRMFSNDMVRQCYAVLPLAVWLQEEADSELLQLVANTYQDGIMREYRPTYRLNQVGFPAYFSVLAQSLEEIEKRGISPQLIEEVRSYPYMPGMAKRQGNWVAYVKGLNNYWWTYEGGMTASNPQAYFGIYKSHGALEIRYIDSENPTSGRTVNPLRRKGMDMSHRSGATLPYRTDEDMIKDSIDSRLNIDSTAVGGAELDKQWGVFMLDLKNTPAQMKDPGFQARKSYFFFRNYIVMIGDQIESDGDYPVYTTLFQSSLDELAPENDPIFINSKMPVTKMDYSTAASSGRSGMALLDADGTGYYIPAGQRVNIERREVSWRMTKTLPKQKGSTRVEAALALPEDTAPKAIAWMDHGTRLKGGSYEYAIMPGVDYEKMAQLRDFQDFGKLYLVVEQGEGAHVVLDQIDRVWAYALYEDYKAASSGPLKEVMIAEALPHEHEEVGANEGYAVLVRRDETSMDLSVSYLDLRMRAGFTPGYGAKPVERLDYGSAPVVLSILVDGVWKVSEENAAVRSAKVEGNSTRLLVQCQDGLSKEIRLTR